MELYEQYQTIERKRKEALRNQDALSYLAMCCEIGIRHEDIEDMPLYEQGVAETSHALSQTYAKLQHEQERLAGFVARAQKLRVYDLARNYRLKRSELEQTFPGQFGRGGKQSLQRMSPVDIGACFKKLYEHARMRCDEKN